MLLAVQDPGGLFGSESGWQLSEQGQEAVMVVSHGEWWVSSGAYFRSGIALRQLSGPTEIPVIALP